MQRQSLKFAVLSLCSSPPDSRGVWQGPDGGAGACPVGWDGDRQGMGVVWRIRNSARGCLQRNFPNSKFALRQVSPSIHHASMEIRVSSEAQLVQDTADPAR